MKLNTIEEFIDLALASGMATLREAKMFIKVSQAPKTAIDFSDLARESGILKPSLCRGIKSLEGMSLMNRWRPRANMRRVIVCLTDKGKDLARKMGLA